MLAAAQTNDAFAHYELLAPLGVGGFATVHLARHRPTGTEVALKVSDPGGDPELLARALNEARILEAIVHPSLARIFESGSLPDGRVFVAMERVIGESLESLLERHGGRLDPRRAARLVIDALSALEAVHARGVVHRDLKPANLLVRRTATNQEQLVVVDFGIAKVGGTFGQSIRAEVPSTMFGAALGTPGYMAPEQLDARSVDPRADLYGIAAVLYRAVSGRKPYEARTIEAFAREVAGAPARPIAEYAPFVSPAIAHVVDRALARDRDARPPTARAMREALEAALVLDVALAGTGGDKTLASDGRDSPAPSFRADAVSGVARVEQSAIATPMPKRPANPFGLVALGFVSMGVCAAIVASIVRMVTATGDVTATAHETTTQAALAPAAATATPSAPAAAAPSPSAEIPSSPAPAADRPASSARTTEHAGIPTEQPRIVAPQVASPANANSEIPLEPPPRHVRYRGGQPVGNIDMEEIEGFVQRALRRIESCRDASDPDRATVSLIFRSVGAPLPAADNGDDDLSRCASSALMATVGGRGTRSVGVVRNMTFVWN